MAEMKTMLCLMLTISLLAGCAVPVDPNYTNYLQVMAKAKAQEQPPLVEMTCPAAGCVVSSFKVYAPPGGGQQVAQIAAPVAHQDQWADVAKTLIGGAVQVGGYAMGAKAALGVANAVKDAGTAGYRYVQAPGSTTTTTIRDSGNTTSTSTNTSTSNSTSWTATNSGNTANPVTTTTTTTTANPITTTTTANPVTTTTANPTTSNTTTTNSNNPATNTGNPVTTYPASGTTATK